MSYASMHFNIKVYILDEIKHHNFNYYELIDNKFRI